VAYTFVLWAISLAFAPVAHMGPLYLAAAVVLGAVFVRQALSLARSHTYDRAMRLFGWSITYITLLFLAMALDQLI
jgi:heme o synthase